MCCEELFTKRPVHRLYAYVRKNLPLYTTPPRAIFLLCDDLLRKLQRGVCIFFFLIFYHLCGSYYVHSNIVNIKGSIQACFFKLSRFQYFLALPFFIRLTLEFTWCLTFSS